MYLIQISWREYYDDRRNAVLSHLSLSRFLSQIIICQDAKIEFVEMITLALVPTFRRNEIFCSRFRENVAWYHCNRYNWIREFDVPRNFENLSIIEKWRHLIWRSVEKLKKAQNGSIRIDQVMDYRTFWEIQFWRSETMTLVISVTYGRRESRCYIGIDFSACYVMMIVRWRKDTGKEKCDRQTINILSS